MDLTKFNPQMNKQRARRYLYSLNSITSNHIHIKNPWMVAWWSMAFPGFGHLLINSYFIGFTLIIWEIFINNMSQLNTAILYSMHGEFETAKDVINIKWFLFYIGMYIFAIWDCYQRTVKINQLYTLAYRQSHHDTVPFYLSPIELNFLELRTPWISVFWTLLVPGVGHIYNRRIPVAFFTLIVFVIIATQANLLEGFHYAFLGEFEKTKQIIQPQWFLYIPSGYLFMMYDAYVNTVENNKMFKIEQSRFLKATYQNFTTKHPI
ncbi:hypothetical protein EJF36_05145 [Bacillus sp. HMF5848]|uniref:hypothetical protein n=1 Tax=Bacillus sp. HMF5848 TaxID=2495421 RepID=UPI000F7752B8|nr:hypothetical protein [Bacillus sp. HMF5848]RSK26293.1 hypothetical protein EJF36_05145 [Bacillus sp. HMF5848]